MMILNKTLIWKFFKTKEEIPVILLIPDQFIDLLKNV